MKAGQQRPKGSLLMGVSTFSSKSRTPEILGGMTEATLKIVNDLRCLTSRPAIYQAPRTLKRWSAADNRAKTRKDILILLSEANRLSVSHPDTALFLWLAGWKARKNLRWMARRQRAEAVAGHG